MLVVHTWLTNNGPEKPSADNFFSQVHLTNVVCHSQRLRLPAATSSHDFGDGMLVLRLRSRGSVLDTETCAAVHPNTGVSQATVNGVGEHVCRVLFISVQAGLSSY